MTWVILPGLSGIPFGENAEYPGDHLIIEFKWLVLWRGSRRQRR
jgi:hypothetical protein